MYSYILDDDRRKNAELFEEAFYEKKNLNHLTDAQIFYQKKEHMFTSGTICAKI